MLAWFSNMIWDHCIFHFSKYFFLFFFFYQVGSDSAAILASLMNHVRDAPVIGHTSCEMQMLLVFHKLLCSNHDLEEN